MSRVIRTSTIFSVIATLAASVVSTATAAPLAGNQAKIEARIVLGPGNFEQGQTLLYRMLVTNRSAAHKSVKLGFFVGNSPTVNMGALYRRQIDIGPRTSRIIDFRVFSNNIPMTGSKGRVCLKVFVGEHLADWTCADSIGM